MKPFRNLLLTALSMLLLTACGETDSAQTSDNTYEARLSEAKAMGKPLFVVFTGPEWCPPCQAMEKDVFPTAAYKALEAGWVVYRVEIPRQPDNALRQLLQEHKVRGVPTLRLINSQNEKQLNEHVGYISLDQLAEWR